MFRRTVLAFALCLAALATVASAQPPAPASDDFLFHKSVFQGREAVQAGIHIVILLPVGPFLPHLREQLLTATVLRTLPNISNGL